MKPIDFKTFGEAAAALSKAAKPIDGKTSVLFFNGAVRILPDGSLEKTCLNFITVLDKGEVKA